MTRLGEVLNTERKKDFQGIINYYKSFKIADALFEQDNLELLTEIHKLAFGIGVFSSKLENIPEYAEPYLSQLKSDTIQLIWSVMMGNRRGIKLLERSIIENLLRYIYYFHHEIEHELLQIEPTKHKTIKELFEYAKRHPFFKERSSVECSIGILRSKYSESSRAVHTGTIDEMHIVKGVVSVHSSIPNVKEECKNFRLLSQSVIFLLSCFHFQEFSSLSLDEKRVITLPLTAQQKRKLSNLI